MTTDFNGLNDILRKDMYKFIDAMKDTLIPMLDMGLESGLKINLIRSIHGLKSLSGMFELHTLSEFINETEEIVHKIFILNRDNIANDLLNDLFVIKDQIEAQFKNYIATGVKDIAKTTQTYNQECIEEFTRHYIEYKMGKELNQESIKDVAKTIQQEEPAQIQNQQIQESVQEPDIIVQNNSDFYLDDNVMYFKPLSLHKDDSIKYQKLFVENLDNVKAINVDLSQTNRLDISGVQFIQSIKKHCKVAGIQFILAGQSELVILEAGMLGVEL